LNLSKIAGLLFLLVGLIYTIMSLHLPDASLGRPYTPKIFPTALGVLMIGLAILLLAQEFRKKADANGAVPQKGVDLENLKQIGLTAVCAILYAGVFDKLGYLLSTILFLEGVLFLFNGAAKWKQNTLVAVIFSVFVYVLFFKLLNVYLPPLPLFD